MLVKALVLLPVILISCQPQTAVLVEAQHVLVEAQHVLVEAQHVLVVAQCRGCSLKMHSPEFVVIRFQFSSIDFV